MASARAGGRFRTPSLRAGAALTRVFAPQETVYHAAAPANAAALSACASSFAAADVRINDVPGSLLQLPLPAGAAADFAVAVTLHGRPEGATLATVKVHVARNAPGESPQPTLTPRRRSL